jgi:mannose-6-phosphate isomerase-like protein (cupin superfamily)
MDQTRLSQQEAKERRPTIFFLMVCLTLATGVTLFSIGLTLSHPGVAAPLSPRSAQLNAALVSEFYAAVNLAIRTGNADALTTIVAPDVAWCHRCSGQAPTREGLTSYLTSFHLAAPNAFLTVESVVAGVDDTVTAQVRFTGYPLLGDPVPWGPVDTFHISGGLIAERRNGPDGFTLVEPLFRTQLEALPPAVTGVVLARLTFPVHAGVEGLLSSGPTVLVVESGEIAVHVAHAGRIVRAGDVETPMGTDALLRQGEAAIIPPGVRHAVRQVGTEPASAVGVTLYFGDDLTNYPAQRRPTLVPFHPTDVSVSTSTSLPPTVQILGGHTMGAWPSGPVRVALGRAVLGSGARLVPSANESILLAVEVGTLTLSGDENRAVLPGTSVIQPAGVAREFRNEGDSLLVLFFLTFTTVGN